MKLPPLVMEIGPTEINRFAYGKSPMWKIVIVYEVFDELVSSAK